MNVLDRLKGNSNGRFIRTPGVLRTEWEGSAAAQTPVCALLRELEVRSRAVTFTYQVPGQPLVTELYDPDTGKKIN